MKTNTGAHQATTRELRRFLRNHIDQWEASGRSTDSMRRLLRDGVAFAAATPIKEDATIRKGYRYLRPQPKECFRSAQVFLLYDETEYATYYEGYLVKSDIEFMIPHAWLVAGGRVFDATMEAADKKFGRDDKERADDRYFGVRFTKVEVSVSISRNKAFVPLLPGL